MPIQLLMYQKYRKFHNCHFMFSRKIAQHTACISFWIPKRQANSTEYWQWFHTLKKKKKRDKRQKTKKKNSTALSELPANSPGRFSQKGQLGLASFLKELIGFFSRLYCNSYYFLKKYETIVSRNGLFLRYSEQDISQGLS